MQWGSAILSHLLALSRLPPLVLCDEQQQSTAERKEAMGLNPTSAF